MIPMAFLHPVDFYQAALLLNARVESDVASFIVRREADGREFRVSWDPNAPKLTPPFATAKDVAQWVRDLP